MWPSGCNSTLQRPSGLSPIVSDHGRPLLTVNTEAWPVWCLSLATEATGIPWPPLPPLFPNSHLAESERSFPSLENQMPDLSLVHKPLFEEGCLRSWPQLPGCTGAELLRQTPLNQKGSADFVLPVLVSYARGQCTKAWWRRWALPGRGHSLILRPHLNEGRELSVL